MRGRKPIGGEADNLLPTEAAPNNGMHPTADTLALM